MIKLKTITRDKIELESKIKKHNISIFGIKGLDCKETKFLFEIQWHKKKTIRKGTRAQILETKRTILFFYRG